MDVTLLYFDGCPTWELAHHRLTTLAAELGFTLERRKVDTPQEAEAVGFRGSPTILVDERDVFAEGHEPVGLSCRVYQTPDGPSGAPSPEQLRSILLQPAERS
jgi:hypothetical protein